MSDVVRRPIASQERPMTTRAPPSGFTAKRPDERARRDADHAYFFGSTPPVAGIDGAARGVCGRNLLGLRDCAGVDLVLGREVGARARPRVRSGRLGESQTLVEPIFGGIRPLQRGFKLPACGAVQIFGLGAGGGE